MKKEKPWTQLDMNPSPQSSGAYCAALQLLPKNIITSYAKLYSTQIGLHSHHQIHYNHVRIKKLKITSELFQIFLVDLWDLHENM